jgi:Tfp pilus assembly protein PilN
MNSIDFLQQQEENKFMQWMLSYGRAIVMLTYFVALLAFLFRFTMDYQISDLHDQITKNALIVKNSKDHEATYRNLQNRLLAIKTLDQKAQTTRSQFDDIVNSTNGNVTFTNLSINNTSIQATVNTNSAERLNAFITDLRNKKYVTSVNIGSIQNQISTGQVVASLSVTIDPTYQISQGTSQP